MVHWIIYFCNSCFSFKKRRTKKESTASGKEGEGVLCYCFMGLFLCVILVFLYRKEGPRRKVQHSENKKKGYFVIVS